MFRRIGILCAVFLGTPPAWAEDSQTTSEAAAVYRAKVPFHRTRGYSDRPTDGSFGLLHQYYVGKVSHYDTKVDERGGGERRAKPGNYLRRASDYEKSGQKSAAASLYRDACFIEEIATGCPPDRHIWNWGKPESREGTRQATEHLSAGAPDRFQFSQSEPPCA